MSEFKVWLAMGLIVIGTAAHAQELPPSPPPLPGVPATEAAADSKNSNPALSKEDQELLYRIATGRPEDVKILLERGANPNATNQGGQTVLAIAAEREPDVGYPMAWHLIEAGADFKKPQPPGSSAFGDYVLHIAILKQNYDLTWYLLSKGADFVNDKTNGKNAFELAQETQNPKIIALLTQAMTILQQRQAYDKSPEMMYRMLEQFAYYVCSQSYMQFYVASKQDEDKVKDDPTYNEEAFRKRQDAIGAFAGEVIARYDLPVRDEARYMQELAKNAGNAITGELNSLIRNSNRRKQGVGNTADREKRCQKVVGALQIRPAAATPSPTVVAPAKP